MHSKEMHYELGAPIPWMEENSLNLWKYIPISKRTRFGGRDCEGKHLSEFRGRFKPPAGFQLSPSPRGRSLSHPGGVVLILKAKILESKLLDGDSHFKRGARKRPCGAVGLLFFLWIVFFLAGGGGTSRAAQSFEPRVITTLTDRSAWRYYPETRGMTISRIVHGRDGSVWFGTAGGAAVRYDGIEWFRYSLGGEGNQDPVRSMAVGPDGAILVCSAKKLFLFDGERWKTIVFGHEEFHWDFRDFAVDPKGRLWLLSIYGFFQADYEALTLAARNPPAGQTVRLPKESVTFHTLQNVRDILGEVMPELETARVPEAVGATGEVKSGTGLEDGVMGMRYGYPFSAVWVVPGGPAQKAGILPGDSIESIAADGKTLDIPSLDFPSGVEITFRIRRYGKSEPFDVTLTTEEQVRPTAPRLILRDLCVRGDGTVWFARRGGDIVRFDPSAEAAGPEPKIVERQAGVASDNPYLLKEIGPWRVYESGSGPLTRGEVDILCADNQDIWVVTRNDQRGVSRFDGKRWMFWRPLTGENENRHHGLFQSRDGSIWTSTASGSVLVFNGVKWKNYDLTEILRKKLAPSDFSQGPDGALWFCAEAGGLYRIDPQSTERKIFRPLNFACEGADGSQWFLAEEGLVRRQGETWLQYGLEDGVEGKALDMLSSSGGVLWAILLKPGGKGVLLGRFDGALWESVPFLNFKPETDFVKTPTAPSRIVESKDGTLLFPVARHVLCRFRPPEKGEPIRFERDRNTKRGETSA